MSAFVRNVWYVAAWAEEVGRGLFARRLLDTPVVMFRRQDGSAVALHDRCPHRFAHLHSGRLVGDAVECGYHGLRFDGSGACVRSPYSDRIPPNAQVTAFPLAERHAALWIWMGDPGLADPALIPDHGHLTDPRYGQVRGCDGFGADYQLCVDNLMELTHLYFLHPSSIGGGRGEDPGPLAGETYSVRQVSDDHIVTTTLTPNNPRSTVIHDGVGPEHPLIDRWNDTHWHCPSNMRFDICATPAGGPREVAPYMVQSHLITPETESSGHYFWAASRTFDLGEEADRRYAKFFGDIFRAEDRPMMEDIQKVMGGEEFWSLRPVILPRDGGAVLARRLVAKKLAREARTTGTMAAE